jgi:hypothetical protein
MRTNSKNTLVAVAFSMLLGACGGGGGDSSTGSAAQQPLSVPLQTAVGNLVNNGITVNFNVTGNVGTTAVTGSGTLTDSKATAAMLNGASVLKTTETLSGTLTANTTAAFNSTRTIFRDPATFNEVFEDDGNFVVAFPPFTSPTTVKAGDGGPLVTGTAFSDSTETVKIGTVKRSFSVTADTATTLLVTFTDSDFDNSNAKQSDNLTTFRIDTAGGIQFVSAKTTNFNVNGQPGNLTFQ